MSRGHGPASLLTGRSHKHRVRWWTAERWPVTTARSDLSRRTPLATESATCTGSRRIVQVLVHDPATTGCDADDPSRRLVRGEPAVNRRTA
jgi:hypothetical protein